jgi:signal transduction histidine kinase
MRRPLRRFRVPARCGIFCIGLIMLIPLSSHARDLYFEQVGNSVAAKSFARVDLGGDGSDEIVVLVDNQAYVYAWDGLQIVLLKQLVHDREPTLIWAGRGDVDGAAGDEFALERLYPDSMALEIYGLDAGRVSLRWHFSLEREAVGGVRTSRGPYPWDAAAILVGSTEQNPNGPRTIIFAFSTGYSLQPRGLIGFDAASGNRAWTTLLGPCPQPPSGALWGSDGSTERLIVAGSSCGNNAIGCGIPDSVAGVFALDDVGRVIWWRQTDGSNTRQYCAVDDITGDGRDEIIVAGRHQERHVGAPSVVRVLATDDGHVIRERQVRANAAALQSEDVDLDKRAEILLLGEDGVLSLYNADLESIACAPARAATPPILVVRDLVGDPRSEILVESRSEDGLEIYDASLELLGRFSIPGLHIQSADVLRDGSGHHLLAMGTSLELRLFRPSWRGYPWRGTASRFSLWLCVIGVGAVVMFAVRRWETSEAARGRIRALVSDLKIIRHGVRLGNENPEPLVRLRRGLRTCTEPGGLDAGLAILRDSETTYRSYVHPTLERIQETAILVHRGQSAVSLWFSMRRATRDLNQLFERLGDVGGQAPLLLRAERSLHSLERKLQKLEALALSRVQSDPLTESSAACEELRPMMRQYNVTLEGIEVAGEPGARVFIDGVELRRILHDLLVNAIESCQDAAEARVRIAIACGERRVVLRVRDNGRGVPSENAEAIFHGKSTKTPPGGVGLPHARRVVESYSGTVLLRESIPWDRTTFEVELCRVPS